MLLSIGVTIASLVIYIWPTEKYPYTKYADPFCTLVFSILVCMTVKPLLSDCLYILMEGAPEAVDTNALKEELNDIEGVTQVKDFHIWILSKGKFVVSSRIFVKNYEE